MRVLLLCDFDANHASMVLEHIRAIVQLSCHDIFLDSDVVKNRGEISVPEPLSSFDAVIIHHSVLIDYPDYLSAKSLSKLAAFDGMKIVYFQDEYRNVEKRRKILLQMGAHALFSCLPIESIAKVYPAETLPGLRVLPTLTAFAPNDLLQMKPKELKKRKFTLSHRGREYPDWLGDQVRERVTIAEQVRNKALCKPGRTSIRWGERSRVYGNAWVSLIRNSRAVLGFESASSVVDFSGAIERNVTTVRSLLGRKTSYEELKQQFFLNAHDKIDVAVVSPRVLEAMALRTACVLLEGKHSSLFVPGDHYIVLERDLSNFDDVWRHLRDPRALARVISAAYDHVATNPVFSYVEHVAELDRIITNWKLEKLNRGAIQTDSEEAILKSELWLKLREEALEKVSPSPYLQKQNHCSRKMRNFVARVNRRLVGP